MSRRESTWYPHPRIADGLGEIEAHVYGKLCGKTSFRNDGFTGRKKVAPWEPGEVVITHKKLMGTLISLGQLRSAIDNLKAAGALIVTSEGKYGNRYLLPQQEAIIPEKFKNVVQDNNRIATGKPQDNNRQTTGQKSSPAGAKVLKRTGWQQDSDRQTAGKQQDSNNNPNKEERINQKLESNIINEHFKRAYLKIEITSNKWTADDDAVLGGWLRRVGIRQVLAAIVLGVQRAQESNVGRISSLKYFSSVIDECNDPGFVDYLLMRRSDSDNVTGNYLRKYGLDQLTDMVDEIHQLGVEEYLERAEAKYKPSLVK